jgi:hypothetical protein
MRLTDPELASLGACLVSGIVGTLLMIENCSFVLGYEKMFFVLAGFAAAYAHLGYVSAHARGKSLVQQSFKTI